MFSLFKFIPQFSADVSLLAAEDIFKSEACVQTASIQELFGYLDITLDIQMATVGTCGHYAVPALFYRTFPLNLFS